MFSSGIVAPPEWGMTSYRDLPPVTRRSHACDARFGNAEATASKDSGAIASLAMPDAGPRESLESGSEP